MTVGALEGLRVVEWCDGVAGSYCGKVLSDLGATVVKLEAAEGRPERRLTASSQAGRFLYLNTGKQSVVRDRVLDSEAEIRSLVADADVVICDEPEVLQRWDEAPSGQVRCVITPFGLTGPYASFKGHHLTVFHSGGEGHLLPSGLGWELFPDRPPVQLGSEMAYYDAGANAAVAILASVLRQRATGRGDSIDVSAQESELTLNRTRLSRYNNDGIELRRDKSRYGAGGMLQCADGWVQLVGMRDEHWTALGSTAEGAALLDAVAARTTDGSPDVDTQRAGLAAWCETLPKREVVRILAAVGCAIGAYAVAPDLMTDPQLSHRQYFQRVPTGEGEESVLLPGAPYRLSRTPAVARPAPRLGDGRGFGSRPNPTSSADSGAGSPGALPLEGVRIADFTWAAAGPYATLLLSFLGAEIVKIESGRRLDPARRGFMADYGGIDRSPNFNELNLNKRSFQVNLTHPAGLEYVRKLIATSDVVVDNFRPGVMARYGLDAESLLAQHPGLVVASSSANGSTGPDSKGAGLASVFGATGGLSEQTGYEDGPPTEVGESTDYRSANALAIAILAALIHRHRTGEGQAIDVSSREVVIGTSPDALLAHLLGLEHPARNGNRHPDLSPHDLYPCRGPDEWVAIAVGSDDEWGALCRLVGRAEWESAYPGDETRVAARPTIDPVITAWTSALDPIDAFRRLQEAGVPAAPCFTNKQLSGDPHLEARQVFVECEHPVIGKVTVMRAPWVLADTDCRIRRPGPTLGQDNRYVIEEILGETMPTDDASAGVFE
jgi:crotonobetainyl-CoA:carnitine CoA-transferase CaiB-like acyl-CoA transferase